MLDIKSLYIILKKNKREITIQLTDASHPIFKAHFPNNPILPGFCHIEILSAILEDKITKVNFLKLQQKTVPKETITYTLAKKSNKRVIKITNDIKQIGEIHYEC